MGGVREAPLGAGVGDAKAFALGVALGVAAGFGDHHGEVAAAVEGEAHAFLEEGGLKAAAAHFGDGGGAAEEGDAFVEREDAGGGGAAVEIGDEAEGVGAAGDDGARLKDKIEKFRMFVSPAASADFAPELRLGGGGGVDFNIGGLRGGGIFDGSVEDAADFDGGVAAFGEDGESGGAGERADLMIDFGTAIEEEALDGVESGGGERLEDAEAEGLGDGRADAVENGVGAAAFDPFGAGVGEKTAAGDGELGAGVGFGAFEAFREGDVGKNHGKNCCTAGENDGKESGGSGAKPRGRRCGARGETVVLNFRQPKEIPGWCNW